MIFFKVGGGICFLSRQKPRSRKFEGKKTKHFFIWKSYLLTHSWLVNLKTNEKTLLHPVFFVIFLNFFFTLTFFAGLVTITGTVKYILFQKYNIISMKPVWLFNSLAMMFFLTLTWHYAHTILHYYYRFSQLPCCCLSYFSHCIHWFSSIYVWGTV